MGIPEGWVTGVPGLSRNDQLKALGNGVVPQQATLALRHLLDRVSGRWCRTGSGTSSPTGGRDSR
jgi:DNA (cytosine-5)-methyltransferase 1